MKRSAGFTLIELIIVIVILGILAVTAAPKFMNMQGDARAATVQAMEASVKSAASMVYSKAIINGIDKSATEKNVTADNVTVATLYGYPIANNTGIGQVLDFGASTAIATSTSGDFGDWNIDISASDTYVIKPKGFTGSGCQVSYTKATSTAAATTISVVTGC
nr:prepilin-type N-terminal cleavage/methylation domain-containing protein [uncultured Tolumonas sp.]